MIFIISFLADFTRITQSKLDTLTVKLKYLLRILLQKGSMRVLTGPKASPYQREIQTTFSITDQPRDTISPVTDADVSPSRMLHRRKGAILPACGGEALKCTISRRMLSSQEVVKKKLSVKSAYGVSVV
jgi:hypothetical protein